MCVADAGLVLKAILGASERSAVRRRLRTGIRCAAVTWAAQFIISTYLRDKQLFPQGRQKLSIEEFQAMHPRKYIQRNVSNQALRAPHCWQPESRLALAQRLSCLTAFLHTAIKWRVLEAHRHMRNVIFCRLERPYSSSPETDPTAVSD